MSTKSRQAARRKPAEHERAASYRTSMLTARRADEWLAANDPDAGRDDYAERHGLTFLPTRDGRPNTLLGGAAWQAREIVYARGADLVAATDEEGDVTFTAWNGSLYRVDSLDAEEPSFDHVTQHHRLHASDGRPMTRVRHVDPCPDPCPRALTLALLSAFGHKGRSHSCLSEGRTYVRSARPVVHTDRPTSGRPRSTQWRREGFWSDATYASDGTLTLGAYRTTRAVVTVDTRTSHLFGPGAHVAGSYWRTADVVDVDYLPYAVEFSTFAAAWACVDMVKPRTRKPNGRPAVALPEHLTDAAYTDAARKRIARRIMGDAEGRAWADAILHAIDLAAATEGRSVSLGHRVSVSIDASGLVNVVRHETNTDTSTLDPAPRLLASGPWSRRTSVARLAAALSV